MADYTKLTVVKLKEELDRRGLSKTGLKAILVQRLVDADAHAPTLQIASDTSDNAIPLNTETEPYAPSSEKIPEEAEAVDSIKGAAIIEVEDPLPANSTTKPDDSNPSVADFPQQHGSDQPQGTSSGDSESLVTGKDQMEVPGSAEKHTSQSVRRENGSPDVPTAAMTSTSSLNGETEDSRKRKRRSQSPVPSSEEAAKRARAQATRRAQSPSLSSEHADLLARPDSTPANGTDTPARSADRRFKELTDGAPPLAPSTLSPALDRDVEPALHPATSALYIANLMRPINIPAFRRYLLSLADGGTSSSPEDAIQRLHLDSMRTHAFVQFTSSVAAARVRSSLHDRVWPEERDRRNLWVDYMPEHRLDEWIDIEAGGANGQNRLRMSTMQRFEIVYPVDKDSGQVAAQLQEVGAVPVAASSVSAGQTASKTPVVVSSPKPSNTAASREFRALDDLFQSTTTKPKLYYLPCAESEVEHRQNLLERGRGGGPRTSEVRRYSFEDGVLVDCGPDFGERDEDPGQRPRRPRGGRGRMDVHSRFSRGGGYGSGLGYSAGRDREQWVRGRGVGYYD